MGNNGTEDRGVRLALYDSKGSLLGYKEDIAWKLTDNPEESKYHSLTMFLRPESDAVQYLIARLNYPDYSGRLYLEDERKLEPHRFNFFIILAQAYRSGEELARLNLKQNEDGLYTLIKI